MIAKTIDDEKKMLKKLYQETKDPVLAIHLIAFGKSINDLLDKEELIFFDTLNENNVKKVIDNIHFRKLNKTIIDKGYLNDDEDDLLF